MRLQDVPAGYQIGDDSFCGELGPSDMEGDLEALIGRERPKACYRQLEQHSTEISLIESTALVFASEDAAKSAMKELEALVGWISGAEGLSAHSKQISLGDESRTLMIRQPSSAAQDVLQAWRNGIVFNYVRVASEGQDDVLDYLTNLVRIQDGRVDKPLAGSPSDTDDREAALDRPGLDVPVYWLGRNFTSSGELPPLKLVYSAAIFETGSGPGNNVQIDYEFGVILTIWEVEAWKSFLESELGDRATAPPCSGPKVIELSDRRIEIHFPSGAESGLPAPEGSGGSQCTSGYVGHVYFDDTVVAINIPFSLASGPVPGLYNSEAGIEAVARGLRLR